MKVGLFGYGHLGKIHYSCLQQTSFELAGIYDPAYVDTDENDLFVKNEDELLKLCDACIIASPTATHFELAKKALTNKKHVMVEKPMTDSVASAEQLVELAQQNPDLVTMVGFVERYNPAFNFLQEDIHKPRFVEIHRLAGFSDRGTDVSVVFDLMIHDIDLLIKIMPGSVTDVRANGISLISSSLDICNTRLEFNDGAVANLTASRMSMKSMRKFRIFQKDTYLSIDLDKKESQVLTISDEADKNAMYLKSGDAKKYIHVKSSGTLQGNAIVDELNEFYNCIVNQRQSDANLTNALQTSILADLIEKTAIKSLDL